ncbi:MAG TPA: hypothetical protein VLM05_07415 [Mycobacteriales bacterium]|nr:hypothetical protein [Mycobacteriales bacterium]
MYATVHRIDGAPGPQDDTWDDAVLTALSAAAVPLGTLVARPVGVGPGLAVALWRDAPGAVTPGAAGRVTVGAGAAYRIDTHRAGWSARPARYLQMTTFTGRDEDWCAAFDRSGEERIWPAVKDLPGLVGLLTGSTPEGDRIALILADSVEALEANAAAIMSTELLPWEDPAHLTGPDELAILRLLHADVPVGADR